MWAKTVSLDGIAERSCIASNPSVPRDDRHERGRLAQCFCGGQVHGVERPNGFYGEGASDPRKDIVSDTERCRNGADFRPGNVPGRSNLHCATYED